MSTRKMSYLTVMTTVFLLVVVTQSTKAQQIYLDPDTVYITGGVGSEFDLELKVDSDVVSLKTFIYYVKLDPSKVDTVSIQEGPLLSSSGAMTVFGSYIVGDTMLQIEGLILGAGIDVSGPGVLATIRFKAVDTGFSELTVIEHQLRDISNTLYPSDAFGSSFFVNVPPTSFGLISPVDGETITGLPGDEFDLIWNHSQSVYPGESIDYTLEYGTSPSFNPGETTVQGNLPDTAFTLLIDDLTEGTYYWRVTATGDLHGFERLSMPTSSSFNLIYGLVEPEEFDLLLPGDTVLIDIYGISDLLFGWEDAVSVIPGDTIKYLFYLGPDPDVPIGAVIIDSTYDESQLTMQVDSATTPLGEWEYWRVNAVNKYDLNRWSTSSRSVMFYNLCDLNHDGVRDIADLTNLIVFLFITYEEPVPLEVANCDCEGTIDVGDLTRLIVYLFIDYEPFEPCE